MNRKDLKQILALFSQKQLEEFIILCANDRINTSYPRRIREDASRSLKMAHAELESR
jgi:hypothetical protein